MGSWKTDADNALAHALEDSRPEWLEAIPPNYLRVLILKYGLEEMGARMGMEIRHGATTYHTVVINLDRLFRPDSPISEQKARHWVEKAVMRWVQEVRMALGGEHHELAQRLLQTEALGLYMNADLADLPFKVHDE